MKALTLIPLLAALLAAPAHAVPVECRMDTATGVTAVCLSPAGTGIIAQCAEGKKLSAAMLWGAENAARFRGEKVVKIAHEFDGVGATGSDWLSAADAQGMTVKLEDITEFLVVAAASDILSTLHGVNGGALLELHIATVREPFLRVLKTCLQ